LRGRKEEGIWKPGLREREDQAGKWRKKRGGEREDAKKGKFGGEE
jgi:hypothetical protein